LALGSHAPFEPHTWVDGQQVNSPDLSFDWQHDSEFLQILEKGFGSHWKAPTSSLTFGSHAPFEPHTWVDGQQVNSPELSFDLQHDSEFLQILEKGFGSHWKAPTNSLTFGSHAPFEPHVWVDGQQVNSPELSLDLQHDSEFLQILEKGFDSHWKAPTSSLTFGSHAPFEPHTWVDGQQVNSPEFTFDSQHDSVLLQIVENGFDSHW